MLVVLRENVENLGRVGDVVKVSDGYARNYLLPRKWVVAADENNVAQIEHHKKQLEKKRLALRASAQELAEKLNQVKLSVSRKVQGASDSNKLFGSVTAQDIVDSVKAQGYVAVTKKMIQLPHAIKTLGKHKVEIRLEQDISSEIEIEVTKES